MLEADVGQQLVLYGNVLGVEVVLGLVGPEEDDIDLIPGLGEDLPGEDPVHGLLGTLEGADADVGLLHVGAAVDDDHQRLVHVLLGDLLGSYPLTLRLVVGHGALEKGNDILEWRGRIGPRRDASPSLPERKRVWQA